MYKYIRNICIYITMSFHRKAGFHWTKKGLTVFAEKPLVIGEEGVFKVTSDLI